jgi:hypothetical protein
MKNNLAPIVLFVYNRPVHALRTLQALKKNDLADKSTLYVYCDGPKANASPEERGKIDSVRSIVKQEKWCGEVHVFERDSNNGLAASIIKGVTEIINRHGKVIVLEDDLETSPGFLTYMNQALQVYESEPSVMHVSGYMFLVKKKLASTFFLNIASCWGWGTWKRAWDKFEINASFLYEQLKEKKLLHRLNIEDSTNYEKQLIQNIKKIKTTWAIKWYATVVLNKGYCLHPFPSLVNNTGNDQSGENCGETTRYTWEELAANIPVEKTEVLESKQARKAMVKFFRAENFHNRILRVKSKIPQWVKKVIIKLINLCAHLNFRQLFLFRETSR